VWGILISFVISLAVALLTPKPKIEDAQASGLEDFNLPTVSESRNVPLVWGRRRVSGPNVFAYGNLVTVAITEKVKTGMFSSDRVTVGYMYYLDIALSICYGEATLRQIDAGDYTVWTGTLPVGAGSINLPNLYGGRDSDGGIQGSFVFYNGSDAQASDPYLNARIRQQPGFKGVAYFVWYGGYVGNTTGLRPFSFVVERYPDPSGGGGAEVEINGDANPAYCLYEMLTNDEFGRGLNASYVDLLSFQTAATTVKAEGLGVSFLFDQKVDCAQIIKQLEQHMNANIYFDPQDGKIKLKLIRDDYVIANLPVLDETNVTAVKNFSRTSTTNLVTEVKVRYTDRAANYKDRVGVAIDTGTRQILGKANSRTLDFWGFSTPSAAAKVSLRDLRTLGAYLAQATITTNRDASDFFPGQVFKFVWSPLNIEQLIMRVKAVDIGSLENGKVTISAVEDVFGTGDAIFDDNPDSGWVPVVTDPLEILNFIAFDAPFWFQQTEAPVKMMWCAQQRNGDSEGYNIHARDNTIGSDVLAITAEKAPYTNKAQLAIALDKENTANLRMKGISDAFGLAAITQQQLLEDGDNLVMLYVSETQHEVVGFQAFTIDGGTGDYIFSGVERGMCDTVALDFDADTDCWFLDNVGTSPRTWGTLAQVKYRLQAVTQTGEFDIGTISDSTHDLGTTGPGPREAQPYPPGRFYVNGVQWPTGILGLVQLSYTWAHRQRSIDVLQTQTDNTGTLEANVTYTIVFKNEAGTTIRTVTGLTALFYNYPAATYTADNGGTAPAAIEATAYAVDSVAVTQSKFSQIRKARLQNIFTQTIDSNDATVNGLTVRNVIPASAILDSAYDGEITLDLSALAGNAITIGEMWLGHQAAAGDAYDFDSDAVQVFFDGGSAGKTIAAGTTIQADPVTYDLDRTKNLVLAIYYTAANASYDSGGVTGAASYTKSGNDAATIDATGYVAYTANRVFTLTKIV